MKIIIINSSWLREFGTFGADFFNLLKKEDYEEILTLTDGEIQKRIKNINLSNQDVITLYHAIKVEFKGHCFNLGIYEGVNPPLRRNNVTTKEREADKKHLTKQAKIKDSCNLKKGYVLLLYALRFSIKKIKDEHKELREKMKHNGELLIKAELKD